MHRRSRLGAAKTRPLGVAAASERPRARSAMLLPPTMCVAIRKGCNSSRPTRPDSTPALDDTTDIWVGFVSQKYSATVTHCSEKNKNKKSLFRLQAVSIERAPREACQISVMRSVPLYEPLVTGTHLAHFVHIKWIVCGELRARRANQTASSRHLTPVSA